MTICLSKLTHSKRIINFIWKFHMAVKNKFKHMKISRIALVFMALWVNYATAQKKVEFKPHGEMIGKIFTNFNTSLSGEERRTGFEVKRAYLGYTRYISPKLSATLKLDIGDPSNDPTLALLKRFAYFKTAALFYTKGNIKVSFGLLDTYQFKVQEKFWSRRYIAKSFMDEYSFGTSADLGTNIQYKIGRYTFDAGMYNGEGYKRLQTDNSYMGALGFTANPFDFLSLRLYGDIIMKSVTQSTYGIFAGLKFDKLQVAGEYNYKSNNRFIEDQNRFGYSIYSHYELLKNWKLFARYDKIESNKPEDAEIPWNLSNDGTALWTGIEYSLLKNLRIALDYQDWYSLAKNGEDESAIFMNIEVTF